MANEEYPGNVLRATLAISPQEAYNGGERTLTLSGGRQVSLRIPPRAYNGQELRLPGQGDISPSGSASDLIITLTVTTAQAFRRDASDTEDPNSATMISYLSSIQPPNPTSPPQNSSTTSANYLSLAPPPPPTTPQMPPYYQPQPPVQPERPLAQSTVQPPSRRNRSALTLLVALAVLVLLGGSALAYLIVIAPANSSASATATAIKNATSTTQAQGTSAAATAATRNAHATATSVSINGATATAIAPQMNDYKKVTGQTPAINDSLQKQSATNWPTGNNCVFKNNAYHITATKNSTFDYCSPTQTNFGNFALQAHATILQGDGAGFIFRADANYNKYYFFIVDSNGQIELHFYNTQNTSSADTLIQRTNSNLLKTGSGQENVICVIARGNTFAFYFNGTYAATITDSANRLTSGHLGLLALDNTNETEVSYTQAEVWKI